MLYAKGAAMTLGGHDLSPDRPADVFEYIVEGGRVAPFGLLFGRAMLHRDSLFVEPNMAGILTRARASLISAFKRRVRFDGDVIAFANGYYRNYYHFVMECLPRIFLARDHLRDDAVIVCPEDVASFHRQWFALLGVADRVRYLPNDVIVSGRRAIATSFAATADNHHPALLKDFRGWIRDSIAKQCGDAVPATPRKILIGRKAGLYRMIVNLAEVQALCREFGYHYVELDDLTVVEQLSIFSGTSHIVALHGAGLANLIVASPGMQLIELINRQFPNRTFEKMGRCLDLRYARLDCEPREPSDEQYVTSRSDIIVDGERLRRLLEGAERTL